MIKKIIYFIFVFNSLVISQIDYSILETDKSKYLSSVQTPELNYPGDSRIDVTYYGLKLKVTSDPEYLSGSVIIGIKSDTSLLSSCFLDLRNELTVDSVLLNSSLTTYTHASHKLNCILDSIYHQNEKFTLEVFYHGVPNSSGFGSFEFSSHNGSPVIWTLSEPYGAPDWFPCKDTPADKADSSDVWITVVDNMTAVSNGTLESIINNGNGTKTYYWKNHYVIGHYLISLAISNYYRYDTYFHYGQQDSMPITNFVYPENFNNVKELLDEVDDMIEVFSERYGLYPFINEKYGHAQTGQSGGMEHQTCTSLGLSAFNPRTVSHELAHQWYGDMITCKDWHHVWLNEGFATYSAAVYIEAKSGKAAYDTYMLSEMSLARLAEGTIWVEDITDINQIFNWNRSYKKAGSVLHMLRGIVGDSVFFNIMRTYSDDPELKWGSAVTEDFQEIAENVYGQDLDYFFQQWIYGENYPEYTIYWNSSPASVDLYWITLRVEQTINSNPGYFTMPVQVKINTSFGDTIITLLNNAQTQDFYFQVYGRPGQIIFDPDNWILKDYEVISGVDDVITANNYILNQNYPNPFNSTTVISWNTPAGCSQVLKIYDMLGNEAAVLFDEYRPAGAYEFEFKADNLAGGVYFYQLKAGDFISTKKMIYLK